MDLWIELDEILDMSNQIELERKDITRAVQGIPVCTAAVNRKRSAFSA